MNTTDRCTQGDLGFSERVITFTVVPCPAMWGEITQCIKSITIQLLSSAWLTWTSIKGKQTPQNNTALISCHFSKGPNRLTVTNLAPNLCSSSVPDSSANRVYLQPFILFRRVKDVLQAGSNSRAVLDFTFIPHSHTCLIARWQVGHVDSQVSICFIAPAAVRF